MMEAEAKRGPGRPRKETDPREDIREKAQAFLDALTTLDKRVEYHINTTFNISYGISVEEMREHMKAFVRSI